MAEPNALLPTILALHDEMRREIVAATERHGLEALAAIDRDDEGDTIYAIDVIGEEIVTRFAERLAREHAIVLVAEGLPGGRRCYPAGVDEASAEWRIIVDPDRRHAWLDVPEAQRLDPHGSGAQSRSRYFIAEHRAGGADRDSARQATPVGPVVGASRRRRARATLQQADGRGVANPIAAIHGPDDRARIRHDCAILSGRA
jgi:hypothetical protein